MLVTHDKYAQCGYAIVPAEVFPRYQAMAEADVDIYCQGRVTPENITAMNTYGVCELIDLYYIGNNSQSDAAKAKQVVTGFRNGEYSETYLGNRASDEATASPDRKNVDDIIYTYFTPDQRWRGIDRVRRI